MADRELSFTNHFLLLAGAYLIAKNTGEKRDQPIVNGDTFSGDILTQTLLLKFPPAATGNDPVAAYLIVKGKTWLQAVSLTVLTRQAELTHIMQNFATQQPTYNANRLKGLLCCACHGSSSLLLILWAK